MTNNDKKPEPRGKDIAEDLVGDADKIPSRLRFNSKGELLESDGGGRPQPPKVPQK